MSKFDPPIYTPLEEEDKVSGKTFISPVWQKWFTTLGTSVNVINNTLTTISGGANNNSFTISSFGNHRVEQESEEPFFTQGISGPQGPPGNSGATFNFDNEHIVDEPFVMPGPPGLTGATGPAGVAGPINFESEIYEGLTDAASVVNTTYNRYYNSVSSGDGAAATPSINYSNALTTGLYWANPGIGFSVAGTSRGTILSTGWNGAVVGTTISASSTITPSQTAGIVGTTTNNNADAGSVGEYATANATSGGLTTATFTSITSVSLTAGDWDVWGILLANAAGTTVVAAELIGISTVNNTLGAFGTYASIVAAFPAGRGCTIPSPMVRLSLSATTTVYVIGYVEFTVSTCTATATINARRVR